MIDLNTLLQSDNDESPYREYDLAKVLTAEQFEHYRSLRADEQVHVAHLVMKGIDYNEALSLTIKG